MKTIQNAIVLSALLSTGIQAAVVLVNGDMEANSLANSGDFSGTITPTGWVGSGTAGTIGEDRSLTNDDPSGIAWLHLQNQGRPVKAVAGSNIGDIAINLNSELNITYTATRRLNETLALDHTIALYAGSSSTWVGGDLLAASSLAASLSNLTEGNPGSYYNGDLNLTLPASYGGTGTNLWLVLQNDLPLTASTGQMHFDNVAVDVVPEPSVGALLCLIGTGSLLIRRRRN